MTSFVQHLLASIGTGTGKKTKSGHKSGVIDMVDTFSRFLKRSIYWADFSRGKFLYVSPHPLFLAGHTPEEVQKMGFSYFEKIIAPEDMNIVMTVNENGYRFFNTKLPVSWRRNCYTSVDFRILQEDGSYILITQTLVPFQLSADNKLISTLAFVTPSHASEPGNAVIQNLSEPLQYRFNPETRRFYLRYQDQLTPREEQILILSGQGESNSAISAELNISVSTVKQHKRNIFRKFDVTNISEAIYYARSNRLI